MPLKAGRELKARNAQAYEIGLFPRRSEKLVIAVTIFCCCPEFVEEVGFGSLWSTAMELFFPSYPRRFLRVDTDFLGRLSTWQGLTPGRTTEVAETGTSAVSDLVTCPLILPLRHLQFQPSLFLHVFVSLTSSRFDLIRANRILHTLGLGSID